MPAAFRVTQALRAANPGCRIILGGPHITLINAAYKGELDRKAPGRAAKALEKMLATYDVLVPGDGEEAIFEAIKPDAPKIVDGDDPKSSLFLTNQKLNAATIAQQLIELKDPRRASLLDMRLPGIASLETLEFTPLPESPIDEGGIIGDGGSRPR